MTVFPKKLFVKEVVDGDLKYFETSRNAAELGEQNENIEAAEYELVRKVRIVNETNIKP